jgi:hypothetical protein
MVYVKYQDGVHVDFERQQHREPKGRERGNCTKERDYYSLTGAYYTHTISKEYLRNQYEFSVEWEW